MKSQGTLLKLGLLFLAPVPVFGQVVSTSLVDGPVQESSRLASGSLVRETHGLNGFRQVARVDLVHLDVHATAIEKVGGRAAVSVRCVNERPACVSSTSYLQGIAQPVLNTHNELTIRCSPAECDRLFGVLKTGTYPAAPAVDCSALRATSVSGDRLTLPPECLTDLDRATTYEPGRVGTPSAPAAREPETTIDGSNIPDRIDFTRPPPSIPRPAVPMPSVDPPPEPPAAPSPTAPPSPGVVASEPPAAGPPVPVGGDAPLPLSVSDVLGNGERSIREGFFATAAAVKDWVMQNAADIAAGAYQEWRRRRSLAALEDLRLGSGRNLPRLSWGQYFVKDHIWKVRDRWYNDWVSRRVTGQPWDSLPMDVQTHGRFMDQTFNQIGPPTPRGGSRYVDVMGEVLGLAER